MIQIVVGGIEVTALVVDGSMDSGAHGFEALTLALRTSAADGARLLLAFVIDDVVATDQWGVVVWQGRLEEAVLTETGVQIEAVGDYAALDDIYYEQLVTTETYPPFRMVEGIVAANPARLADNNALIYQADVEQVTLSTNGQLCREVLEKRYLAVGKVWSDKALQLGADDGQVFELAEGAVVFGRSLASVVTAAFTEYKDGSGNRVKTALLRDETGVAATGIERQLMVSADLTSSTEAQAVRDAAIDWVADFSADARVEKIYFDGGGCAPLAYLRAGDVLRVQVAAELAALGELVVESCRVGVDGSVGVKVRVPELEGLVAGVL